MIIKCEYLTKNVRTEPAIFYAKGKDAKSVLISLDNPEIPKYFILFYFITYWTNTSLIHA